MSYASFTPAPELLSDGTYVYVPVDGAAPEGYEFFMTVTSILGTVKGTVVSRNENRLPQQVEPDRPLTGVCDLYIRKALILELEDQHGEKTKVQF